MDGDGQAHLHNLQRMRRGFVIIEMVVTELMWSETGDCGGKEER